MVKTQAIVIAVTLALLASPGAVTAGDNYVACPHVVYSCPNTFNCRGGLGWKCHSCDQSVTSWPECYTLVDNEPPFPSCQETYTTRYCGTHYESSAPVVGICPGQCTIAAGDCGDWIPDSVTTEFADNCP